MADSLLIPAHILTPVGTALKTPASLKDAPAGITALKNEVSELRLVFWKIGFLPRRYDRRAADVAQSRLNG